MQEFVTKSISKDANLSKKAKRAREDEEEEDAQMVQMVLEAVTNELAGKRMLEDDYTFEIERRKEQAIAALARYESMSALVKKSLKGAALSNKSCEIENKFSDLGEMLVALTTLSD